MAFELARQAKVMRPTIKAIYLSGDSAGRAKSSGPVLQKPMRRGDLVDEVGRQLA